MLKQIAVYCGSSKGNAPLYSQQARALGREMCRRNIGMVFGGGKVGLMGEIADAMLELNGYVHGIMPRHLFEREVAHDTLSKLTIVDSMHTRKAMMEEQSDGFIAMPGGMGTLDEIAEIFTWSQLELHQKPMAFYNVNSYFDPLFDFFDQMVREGFLQEAYLENLIHYDDPLRLLDAMAAYSPKLVRKWTNR